MRPDLILPYEGVLPRFSAPPVLCGRESTVIGSSVIGAEACLGEGSVIRGDGETITIGDRFWLGPRSTVHIATGLLATQIGNGVTVGRNAVVHACTVGSDVVVGHDAVILDGSIVGDGAVIEAGAIVFPRSRLESGFVYGGSPAKRLRPISPEERAERAEALRRAASPPIGNSTGRRVDDDASVFVARTARVSGRVTLGAESSVYFSCALEADHGSIVIGAGTNIQDNSTIRSAGEGVVIGRDTTIGHNVRMADCRIGARSLIGIGCVLAPGTIVADDVLLAGGATTEPGQLLESGRLWGGRPARILAPLDADKREMMRRTVEGYLSHCRTYRQAEEVAG